MFTLSDKDAESFRQLHKAHTGEDLTLEEAKIQGERVIRLVAFAGGYEPFLIT